MFSTKLASLLLFITAVLAGWQGWSTKKAARAAEIAANVAKDSMQIDQRAWLAVTDIYTLTKSKLPELGEPLYARIQFKNAGKTPALYTRVSRNEGGVRADYMLDTLKNVEYSKIAFSPVGTVPPGSDNPFTEAQFLKKLGKEDLEAIKADKLNFFVYGKVIYCDVFGREHWMTYCYHLLAGGAYAVCRNNNDVDTAKDEPCHGN